MRIKKIYEEMGSLIPEIMPSDEELLKMYPYSPDVYTRRTQYKTDHKNRESAKDKQRLLDREEEGKQKEIEQIARQQEYKKQRSEEERKMISDDSEKEKTSNENERKIKEVTTNIAHILNKMLNKNDDTFLNELNNLIGRYDDLKPSTSDFKPTIMDNVMSFADFKK